MVWHCLYRTNWLQSSTDILSDTRLIFSVELRKKYTIYRQLLQLPYSSSASCPLALSLTTRRINADWDITVHSWEQRIQRGRLSVTPQAHSSWGDPSSACKNQGLVYRTETWLEPGSHTPKSSGTCSRNGHLRSSHDSSIVPSRRTGSYQAFGRHTHFGSSSNYICY